MPRKFKQAKRVLKPTLRREISFLRKMSKKTPLRKRVVVHLGNTADTTGFVLAEKTNAYSARFPNTQFIGIDVLPVPGTRRNNWQQIKASFNAGLKRLKNNSVDLISSEMALGYYDSKSNGLRQSKTGNYKYYTQTTIKTAFQKLRPGGKLQIAVTQEVIGDIIAALKKAGFKEKNTGLNKIKKDSAKRTAYIKYFSHTSPVYQIVAVK